MTSPSAAVAGPPCVRAPHQACYAHDAHSCLHHRRHWLQLRRSPRPTPPTPPVKWPRTSSESGAHEARLVRPAQAMVHGEVAALPPLLRSRHAHHVAERRLVVPLPLQHGSEGPGMVHDLTDVGVRLPVVAQACQWRARRRPLTNVGLVHSSCHCAASATAGDESHRPGVTVIVNGKQAGERWVVRPRLPHSRRCRELAAAALQ